VTKPVRVPAFPTDCTRAGAGRLVGGAWAPQKAGSQMRPTNKKKGNRDGEISCFDGDCMVPLRGSLFALRRGLKHRANAKAARNVRCKCLFPGENPLISEVFWAAIRDVQAGTPSTGGGRLKRAKVESPLESTVGGRVCSTTATAAAWAGAVVCCM
jgi:hypothetical protein